MSVPITLLSSEQTLAELPPLASDWATGETTRARGADAASGRRAHSTRVLAAALDLLRQVEDLISSLSVESYAFRQTLVFDGSIGGHVRHCLDHFASLLEGYRLGFVDYDHRQRSKRVETDPQFALQWARALRQRLGSLRPETLGRGVAVRCEVSYEKGDSPLSESCVGRELMYAIAHGIHHFALIAVMARLQGVALPPHFGVAPSTVAHLASEAINTR